MKDNNLIIILVIILILIVCYYIYKKCNTKTIIINNQTKPISKKSNFQNTVLSKEDNLSIVKFLKNTQIPFVIKKDVNNGDIFSIEDNKFISSSTDLETNNQFIFLLDEEQGNFEIKFIGGSSNPMATPNPPDDDDPLNNIFYYYDMEYYLPSDTTKAIAPGNELNLNLKKYYSRIFVGNSNSSNTQLTSFLQEKLEPEIKTDIRAVSIKIPQQSNNMNIAFRKMYVGNLKKKTKKTNDSYQTMTSSGNLGENNFSEKLKDPLYHNYYFKELISKNSDKIKNNHKLRFGFDDKGLYLISHNQNKPYGIFYNNTPIDTVHDQSTDYLETISISQDMLNKKKKKGSTPFKNKLIPLLPISPNLNNISSLLNDKNSENSENSVTYDTNQTTPIKYKQIDPNYNDIIIKDRGGLINKHVTLQLTKKIKEAEKDASDDTYKFFDDVDGKINNLYPRYTLHTLFVPIGKEINFIDQNDNHTFLTNDYIAINALLNNKSNKDTDHDLYKVKNRIINFDANDNFLEDKNNNFRNYNLMNVDNTGGTQDNHRSSISTNTNIQGIYDELPPLRTSSLYIDRIYCPSENVVNGYQPNAINIEKHLSKNEYDILTAKKKKKKSIKTLFSYGKDTTDIIQKNLNNVMAHQTCKLFNYNNKFNLSDVTTNSDTRKYMIVDQRYNNLAIHNQDVNGSITTESLNTPYFIPILNPSADGSNNIQNYMVSKSKKFLLSTLNIVNTEITDTNLIYIKSDPINFIKSYYTDMLDTTKNIELSPNTDNIMKIINPSMSSGEEEYYIVKKEGNILYFLYEDVENDQLSFVTKFDDSEVEHDKYLFNEFTKLDPSSDEPSYLSSLIKTNINQYFTDNCKLLLNSQEISVKQFFNLIENKSNSNLKQLLINYIFDTSISNNDLIPNYIFEYIPENADKWFGLDKNMRIIVNTGKVVVYNSDDKVFELVNEAEITPTNLSKYKSVFLLEVETGNPILYIGYDFKTLENVELFNISALTITGTSSFKVSNDDVSFFYKLVDNSDNKILHLEYNNGKYEIVYYDKIHFFTMYNNGELTRSISPYIDASTNQFIISDPSIPLNTEPYTDIDAVEYPTEIIPQYYYKDLGEDKTNNPKTETLTPIFIINILNTPLKSNIIINKNLSCPNGNFKLIYNIDGISGVDLSNNFTSKIHTVVIKTTDISNDYSNNITTTDNTFKELIGVNERVIENLSNLNNNLDTQIISVTNFIDKLTNENKDKLVEINNQGQYFRNVINTEINNKLKKISTIQFNIQNVDKKVRNLKIKFQLKVKYSFAVTQDDEYLAKLIQKISEMKFTITMLENKLSDQKSEIYKNYTETNNIIKQINNFIYVINKTINNKKQIKEYFSDNNISRFNEHLFNNNNIIVSNFEDLNVQIEKHNTNLDKRNKLIIEKDKLSVINVFYNKLILSLTGTDDNSIKSTFASLITDLDDLENKLTVNLNKSRMDLINIENKYKNAEFTPIELVNNSELVYQLEIELVELEDIKERLNKKIKNINQSERATQLLDTLKTINTEINKPQLRDFNPMEAFQNPQFRSAESHNNHFLSLKPMNNNQYKIRINDKCLNVYGTNDYRLGNCNLSTSSQLFETQRINTEVDAINKNKDQIYESNVNNIKYPYYQIKSTITNDCVNMDRDGVSLTTCSSNSIKQRWNLSTDEKICLDN